MGNVLSKFASPKLIGIYKSDRKGKKYYALFSDGSKVYFGASGYEDYTIHKDPARKERYIKRHEKNENWNNPVSAGALSRWILWNKPTISESIADYKRRFGL